MFLDARTVGPWLRLALLCGSLLSLLTLGGCEEAFCPSGTEGCACQQEDSCRSETLECVQGLCVTVNDACPAGTEGCACLLDDRCRLASLTCDQGTCVPRMSEPAPEAGPEPEPLATCDEEGRCIPEEPVCYTPCQGDLPGIDGGVRTCSGDGLMEGCFRGAFCDRGSCVPISMSDAQMDTLQQRPGTCEREADCPGFQTCILGRCYSECEDSAACAEGWSCRSRVCRESCGAEQECSKRDFTCSDGACMPLARTAPRPMTLGDGRDFVLCAPGEQPGEESDGGESCESVRVPLSAAEPTGSFQLYNLSGEARSFVVRKSEQHVRLDDGTEQVLRASEGDVPLPWVHLGATAPQRVQELRVDVEAGASVEIQLGEARNENVTRWTGWIDVESVDSGVAKRAQLLYGEGAAGRWTGQVYYFGNFADGSSGTGQGSAATPLELWQQNKPDLALADAVPNAFVQAWARFRRGLFSLDEMEALLTATVQETWQLPRVQELCGEAGYGQGAACALFGGGPGSPAVLPYTSDVRNNRIPSGVVPLDFSMAIGAASPAQTSDPQLCDGAPHCLVGRIVSSDALQYAGDPEVVVTFDGDPVGCEGEGDACVRGLSRLDATVLTGGRYTPEAGEAGCTASDFAEAYEVPWLVPGFAPPGALVPGDSERRKRSCRQVHVPFTGQTALNGAFAAANPVPDGLARIRRISLVDGVLVNQHTLLLLVRETVDGFQGGAPLASYAVLELKRELDSPEADELIGQAPEPFLGTADPGILESTCSQALISTVAGSLDATSLDRLSDLELRRLGRAVVRGDDTSINDTATPAAIDVGEETAHYLCVFDEDAVIEGQSSSTVVRREVFGAGANDDVPCPPFGQVIFFTIGHDAGDPGSFAPGFDPTAEPCNVYEPGQQVETCFETLKTWAQQGRPLRVSAEGEASLGALAPATTTFDLRYQCEEVGGTRPITCDQDRFDYRAGKIFLQQDDARVFFDPLESEIHRAFRYRTQFVSRSNINVGFVPAICSGGSDIVPYCYEPSRIAEIVDRVDCALALYHGDYNLDQDTLDTLRAYLEKNFSALQLSSADADPVLESGFERLYAELLIMLGDDALVAASGSRFDLAATRQLAFEGSEFEPSGVDLSGFLGFEMYKLYEATQYFEMVVDRFYSLSPRLWENVSGPDADRYVGQMLVTTYLDHVIRASTQLARAYSEIAERYHGMNRPDLARRVLERAYTRAYQESGVLGRIMTAIMQSLDAAAVPQVILEVEAAQRSYRVAMLDMKDAYDRITEQQLFFGLPPNYVPFPALDEDDVNGLEVILARAKDRMEVASTQEALALERAREFDVDDAEFQRELVDLRNNYEAQLSDICGSFTGTDGRVYPALTRYAHLNPDASNVADPCGLESGDLWFASADLQTRYVELQGVRKQVENLRAQYQDSLEWVEAQCELINEDVEAFLEAQGAVDDLTRDNEIMQATVAAADRVLAFVDGLTARVADSDSTTPWGAVLKASAGATYATAAVAHFITATTLDAVVVQNQSRIRTLERNYAAREIGRQCDYLSAELVYTLREIQREISLLELDTLNAVWNVQAELARITGLDNERRRLEAEWEETNELTVNVAAARNDPNIRIYKNDAILNAERSFELAVQEAYRATRIYEYYTASSYAALDKLFLVRMVDAGDLNLRRYLTELESAFYEFEDVYGNPDTRVHRVSVMDDVLKVPRYSTDGMNRVLSVEERTQRFRQMLQEPSRLNDDGHLTMKFATSFDVLSPLTVNHKVLFLEVEVLGSDPNLSVGDNIGRFYLKQSGTGVVRDPSGGEIFYAFPARTAVVNPVINGDRDFGQDSDGAIAGATRSIFRSYRFRERPFVQTDWELILNQVTEIVNEDINLGGIDDIAINIFYTDFTPQP